LPLKDKWPTEVDIKVKLKKEKRENVLRAEQKWSNGVLSKSTLEDMAKENVKAVMQNKPRHPIRRFYKMPAFKVKSPKDGDDEVKLVLEIKLCSKKLVGNLIYYWIFLKDDSKKQSPTKSAGSQSVSLGSSTQKG